MHLTLKGNLLHPDKYKNYSDQELLNEFHYTKNNEWLGILFPRYTLLIYGVCMKYLKNEQNAKDGTQQIFIKCIDELHKYQVTYFKSWVYMITKNYCLMQLRNAGQKNTVELEQVSYFLKEEAEEENSIEKLKEKNLTIEHMLNSLEFLNEEQRQCVTLFYLEKKSYQEIADLLHLNYMQVKSAIQNGKRNLKLILEKNNAK